MASINEPNGQTVWGKDESSPDKTMGHKSTHVTETVYRHVIVPAIRGGATVMDNVFGADVLSQAT